MTFGWWNPLRAALPELARQHHVPGVQLAVHHRDRTVATEVGELEAGSGHPVRADAAFPIGSITKTFTATLAMMLVADGDLELDAPVGDYLPELHDRDVRPTVGQVLSHTGGLPSDPRSLAASRRSPRRYVLDACRRQSLVLDPGAGFSYSNAGYVLVGRLIETVTGMSWAEAMASVLLRPLGIGPAFIEGLGPEEGPGAAPGLGPAAPGRGATPRRAVATGHSVNADTGRTRPVRQSLAPAQAPAGALAVSASDLAALGRVHIGAGFPEVLSPADAERMRQPAPMAEPFGLAEGWGLGMALYSEGPLLWVGHDGNADGTACYLRIQPAAGWVIAFTSNAGAGTGLWRDLLGELARAGVPIEPPRSEALAGSPAAPPPDCAGTYANGDVEYVVAGDRDGQLRLSVDGADFAPLTCYEGSVFSVRDPESGRQVLGGRFLRDRRTGSLNGLQIGGRLARPLERRAAMTSPSEGP